MCLANALGLGPTSGLGQIENLSIGSDVARQDP